MNLFQGLIAIVLLDNFAKLESFPWKEDGNPKFLHGNP